MRLVNPGKNLPPCEFRKRLQRIVDESGGRFRSIKDLTIKATVTHSTVNNGLAKAEKAGVEPKFEVETLKKLAGKARVSLSWLEGTGKNKDAEDIPEEPEEPQDLAARRLGGAGAELVKLKREVAALRQKLREQSHK